mmetsp:Transcript_22578/g.74885  ORF Transcript_22578/g.74885 Transcript_22578/m.74885 type:complete len:242 (+) Transcript_22578:63-788(+)
MALGPAVAAGAAPRASSSRDGAAHAPPLRDARLVAAVRGGEARPLRAGGQRVPPPAGHGVARRRPALGGPLLRAARGDHLLLGAHRALAPVADDGLHVLRAHRGARGRHLRRVRRRERGRARRARGAGHRAGLLRQRRLQAAPRRHADVGAAPGLRVRHAPRRLREHPRRRAGARRDGGGLRGPGRRVAGAGPGDVRGGRARRGPRHRALLRGRGVPRRRPGPRRASRPRRRRGLPAPAVL